MMALGWAGMITVAIFAIFFDGCSEFYPTEESVIEEPVRLVNFREKSAQIYHGYLQIHSRINIEI